MDEIPDIKRDFNTSKMCRSCLLETEDEMNEIFGFCRGQEEISINQILINLASVQIDINDGLPDKICKDCTEQAYLSYTFKATLEQSDSTLRGVLFKDQMPEIKKDDAFDENSYLMGIKTEIAFVDADPFIDDEDYGDGADYGENTGEEGVDQQHQQQQQQQQTNDSYSSYGQDGTSEMSDSSDEECDEDGKYDMKPPKDKSHKKASFHQLLSPSKLENVEYIKDAEGKYVCQICNKKLCDKKGLNLHIRLHTGENLKRCHICSRGFIKSDHLRRHLLIHDRTVNCEYCDDTFTTRQEYKTHVKEEHDDEADFDRPTKTHLPRTNSHLNANCKICDKKFLRIITLRNHLNQHLLTNTFDDVEIKNKIFLFNPLEVDLEKSTNEELHIYLKNKLSENDCDKFYQILTRDGHEMMLSDSESEDESESPGPTDDRIELSLDTDMTKKIYHCTKCTKTFKRSKESMHHMMLEHLHELPDFIDKCATCSKSFPNTGTLHKHLKSQCENKSKKLACNTCSKKFMWLDSMAKHIENEHPGTEKIKLYTCEMCGKAFSRSEHLERHRKTHNPSEKKFECPVCQKKFNRKDNLRSHMKIHKDNRDDEDKHLCIYCGRSFSNSSNLIVHMRRHTGEKPYKCDLCDKGFPRSSDLQCHRRTHTGEKPCLCTICGKGFSRSNKLVRHMRIHTGVRPYQCTYCDRAFTQSNDLTLHIRRHTGEKPYVCGVCGDRFIQGTALKQHQRMQGHFEGTQPSPYASISVNNPSRYTNSNLVNRRYCVDQGQQQAPDPAMPIKQVIPRRRTANNINLISQQQSPGMNSTSGMNMIQNMGSIPSTSVAMGQDNSSDVMSLRSPSPHHSSATHTPVSTPIPHNLSHLQDIKPNIQNLSAIPPSYNGMHFNMVPNMEIAALFSMNFNNQHNQQNNHNSN